MEFFKKRTNFRFMPLRARWYAISGVLIVASAVSVLLGDIVEGVAIMAIVILNAVIGLIQEQRADAALEALKKMSAPDAQVLRDGTRQPWNSIMSGFNEA